MDNLVDWRGPNYVGLCMTMAYDLYVARLRFFWTIVLGQLLYILQIFPLLIFF